MSLNTRAEVLFKTLVQLYIDGGQPVGSRTLARQAGLELSPATIRNVMADLEELGLVESPHTSAGRVPTQLGYRLFVDSLVKVSPLDQKALHMIEDKLTSKHDPQALLASASSLLSEFTHLAGVVTVPKPDHAALRQLEFVRMSKDRILVILVTNEGRVQNQIIGADREYSDSELVEAGNFFNATYGGMSLDDVRHELLTAMERDSRDMHRITQTALEMARQMFQQAEDDAEEELVVSGEANLLEVPEWSDVSKLRDLFSAFKRKRDLLHLLDRSVRTSGIQIFIGDESGYRPLHDCSVISAPYEVDGSVVGTLAVVGPTRMSYERVIPMVDVTARLLSSALRG